MKEPIKDDERLSALLDGRVAGGEREELLAHLARSDEDYEVFAGTARVLRALEREDAPAAAGAGENGILPFRRRVTRDRWLPPAGGLAVAAAVAGVLLVSVLLWRGRASGDREPLQLAALAVPAGQEVPDTLIDRALGEPFRGGAPAGGAERSARAVQAGAMLVNLSVAARAGDTERTRLLAGRTGRYFDPGASAGNPLEQIAARPDAPPDSLARLVDQATEQLAGLGRESLELGAWLQAARFAALGRNGDFFEDGAGRAVLKHAARLTRGDDGAQAAVERVREALPAQGPPQWESLRESLDALMIELAS